MRRFSETNFQNPYSTLKTTMQNNIGQKFPWSKRQNGKFWNENQHWRL